MNPTFARRLGVFGTAAAIPAATCTLLLTVVPSSESPATVVAPIALAAPQSEPGNMVDEINQAFGVYESDLAFIDVQAEPGEGFSTIIPIDGAATFVDFFPHSVRAESFKLLVDSGNGDLEEIDPGIERTYRGEVPGMPYTSFAGSLLPDGLIANAILPDNSQRYIEPVHTRIPDAPQDLYIIYRGDAVLGTGGVCGNDDHAHNHGDPGFGDNGGIGGIGNGEGGFGEDLGNLGANAFGSQNPNLDTYCRTQLALDADYEFFTRWITIADTQLRIETIINAVNLVYETQAAITHEVVSLIIHNTPNDPYTDTTDAATLVGEFVAYYQATFDGVLDYDVAHLFTGKNLDGGTIGIAASIGDPGDPANTGICSPLRYCLSQSFDQGASAFESTVDLTTHELGHVWGAVHCGCPSNIMFPADVGGSGIFSAQSLNAIWAFRAVITCLDCRTGGNASIGGFVIKRGTWRAGDVDDILVSDGESLKVDSAGSGSRHSTVLRVNAVAPARNASSIEVGLETGVTANGVTTRVYIFNFETGQWERFDSFAQPRSDTMRHIVITHRPRDYIDNSTNRFKLKIVMKGDSSFTSRYDCVAVHLSPAHP